MDRPPAPDEPAVISLIGLENNCRGEPLPPRDGEAIIGEEWAGARV